MGFLTIDINRDGQGHMTTGTTNTIEGNCIPILNSARFNNHPAMFLFAMPVSGQNTSTEVDIRGSQRILMLILAYSISLPLIEECEFISYSLSLIKQAQIQRNSEIYDKIV